MRRYLPVELELSRGTGEIPTSVAEAGGYPQIRGGTPPADTDHDGMPDVWEQKRGLNPADPEDRNLDPDGAGYTNLEIYLNSLIPLPARQPRESSNSTGR